MQDQSLFIKSIKSKRVSAKVALWAQRWRDDGLEVWANWLRDSVTHRDAFCDTYSVQKLMQVVIKFTEDWSD